MHWSSWLIVASAAWLGFAALARALLSHSIRRDAHEAIVFAVLRAYARLIHRLRVFGTENLPAARPDADPATQRPLLLVANHTAGVDPLLIQAAFPRWIRWVMAEDMAIPELGTIWEFAAVILVDRKRSEALNARRIIRAIHADTVVGLFPEGFIERPPRQILPFHPGVGLCVQRTGALVAPVIIDGAPQVEPAWSSLWRRSRTTLRFLPLRDYTPNIPAQAIADDLRSIFLRETRWPANNDPNPGPSRR